MRCQICNKPTRNFKLNVHTGKYESICNRCANIIHRCKYNYTDFEDVDKLEEMSEEEFLRFLQEEC